MGGLTRERILAAAREALERYGPRKVSLGDVAGALGVTKAALYHHFPGGKGEIIGGVLGEEAEAILAAMRSAAAEHSDARERFRAAVVAKLERVRWLLGAFTAGREAGETVRSVVEAVERRFAEGERALYEAIVRAGQAAGTFREASVERLARGVRSALRDLETTILLDPGAMEETVDELFDILFYGLVRRRDRGGER